MELHLKIIGVLLILLGLSHFFFPRYFYWKQELVSLSILNRQMMYVHAFFVAFVVLLMGIFCICCTEDILYTRLGKQVSLGLFLFWATRLVFQFFVYSPRLWKGKRLETFIHVLFSLFWTYFSAVFGLVYLQEHLA